MLDKSLIPETIPFDFDETYAAVRDKFAEYGYDLQEGSNTMQLAIAMSYLTSMLNANTAVNINEMLLPLARKRKMILQDARLLGYEPRHLMSYKYKLTLEFPEGLHQINRYEKFTVKNKDYYYMQESIPAFYGPKTLEITVAEGNLKQWSKDPSLVTNLSVSSTSERVPVTDYFVDVPFTHVAENGLRVFISYTEPSGQAHDLVEYPRLDNFIIDRDSRGNPGYIRLDNIEFGTPRIYFKLGGVGVDLPENTKVFVDALISSGLDGEMPETTPDKIETTLNCSITDIELLSNGINEECPESIKRNAPLFYNSANRLVTKEDYRAFVERDPRAKFSTIWDGEDEYPRKPGNIWFSTIPRHTIREFKNNELKTKWNLEEKYSDRNWYLTDADVQDIKDLMKPVRIPTMTVHHRQPVYLDFDFTLQVVRYSRSLTPTEWNEKIFNVINEYFLSIDSKLGAEVFGFEYFQSSLIKRIDETLTDITGFNIELKNSITLSDRDIINEVLNKCTYGLTEVPEIDENRNQVRFHLGTPFEKYIDYVDSIVHVITDYLPRIHARINNKNLHVDFTSPTLYQDRLMQYPVLLGNDYIGEYQVSLDTADTIEVILFNELEPGYELNDALQNNLKIDVTYNSPNFKVTRNTIPALSSVEFINR